MKLNAFPNTVSTLLLSFLLVFSGGMAQGQNLHDDFFIAARNGNDVALQGWLNRGMDANARDERGETPLMAAVRAGDHPEVVTALLAAGAKPWLRNPYAETALMLAAFHGRAHSVAVLLERGTDIGEANRMGWTPLLYAAFAGHATIVEQLLKHGALIDFPAANGMTALMLAARNGHAETVELLLARGADRSLKSQSGASARQMALEAGNTYIAERLQ
jgi:ankyrin repeat protein